MRRFSLRQRGVSMIECCVVLTIVGTIAGMASASFDRLRQQQALAATAQQFVTDIELARATTLQNGRAVRLSFEHTPAGSCYVLHSGAARSCRCEVAHGDAVARCSGDETVMRTAWLPADGPVRMTSGVDSMLFGAHRHTVSPAGSVTLRSRDGSTLRAVVGITGRVRVCAVGQRSAGRPRC